MLHNLTENNQILFIFKLSNYYQKLYLQKKKKKKFACNCCCLQNCHSWYYHFGRTLCPQKNENLSEKIQEHFQCKLNVVVHATYEEKQGARRYHLISYFVPCHYTVVCLCRHLYQIIIYFQPTQALPTPYRAGILCAGPLL